MPVTTVFLVTLVTTVLNDAFVTTVFAVTGFNVLFVLPAVCTAILPAGVYVAVPLLAAETVSPLALVPVKAGAVLVPAGV